MTFELEALESSLVNMQIMGSHPRHTTAEPLQTGSRSPCFNSISRWLFCVPGVCGLVKSCVNYTKNNCYPWRYVQGALEHSKSAYGEEPTPGTQDVPGTSRHCLGRHDDRVRCEPRPFCSKFIIAVQNHPRAGKGGKFHKEDCVWTKSGFARSVCWSKMGQEHC